MATKRVQNNYDEDEEDGRPKKVPKTLKEKDSQKRLVLVLERANLETIKIGKNFELLNSDKHKSQIAKYGREAARPDITHQCLMMLLDSPLNRAGMLQIYIHTERNVLIEVHPQTRIPRTFDRYCGLMVQLLHKLSIHAADGPMKLMKVIKNPITDHLPTGCRRIGTSFNAEQCLRVGQFAQDGPVVFVVGAMAHGKVSVDYTDQEIAISEYPLSAALTCTKICSAFEEAWGIH